MVKNFFDDEKRKKLYSSIIIEDEENNQFKVKFDVHFVTDIDRGNFYRNKESIVKTLLRMRNPDFEWHIH